MSYATACAAVDATIRSALAHGYPRVRLKYAGGEALLHMDRVAAVQRYARQAAAAHGLALEALLLSNGTLLQAAHIATLRELDIALVVSLDSTGAAHDSQRPFAGGQGTAAAVMQAVDRALAHGLVPGIAITVSGRNAAELPDLLAWVLARDLPFGINFYRDNDYAASHADLQLEEAQLVAGMLAAFRVIEAHLPRHSLLAALVDHADLAVPHSQPCSVGESYLVFDPQGRVAKCQMQLDQTVTTAHDADPLAAVRADTAGIRNLPVEQKAACRACAWRQWCAGGCPLTTHRATGRYDVPSPHCAIYRRLFPEVLRLEALRVARYAEAAPV
jgi:uncharacterized protein